VLPSNTYPAVATAESSHGLQVPSALEEFEVHSPRASRPATFRLQGLITLLAACSLESRASSVSHRRRSWDSPFGGFLSREVSPTFRLGRTHLPLAQRFFRRRSVRPARGASVSGFTPPGIALRPHGVLSRQPPAPPLGFAPLGFVCEGLAPGFPGAPPACLTGTRDYSRNRPAPRSVYRSSPSPARMPPECHPAKATLMGFLHLPAPEHSSPPCPGY